jgi:hypothetical protein
VYLVLIYPEMSSAEVQIMVGKTQVLNYQKKKAKLTAATDFEMICQHRGPNNMKGSALMHLVDVKISNFFSFIK